MPPIAAPAKVNLRLVVMAREESGYHQLETIFCALTLADALTLDLEMRGLRVTVHGADLGPPEQNLVYRAARAFFTAAGLPEHARIVLHKSIPAAAGLGGGSSDAASTLRGLNEAHGSPLDDVALTRIAGTLGADVPFFLCGSPCALGWNRGDRLLPLDPLPQRPVLLAVPPRPIPTADAYRALAAARSAGSDAMPGSTAATPFETAAHAFVLSRTALADWDALRSLARNDFEDVLFPQYPELAAIRDDLIRAGATVALMAGSGSAVFGVFPHADARANAVERIAANHVGVRTIETRTGR